MLLDTFQASTFGHQEVLNAIGPARMALRSHLEFLRIHQLEDHLEVLKTHQLGDHLQGNSYR